MRLLIDPVKAFVISRNKSFYNDCNIILVPSQSLIEELATYGIDSKKMRLWRRGMDTSLFSPNKKNLSILHGLPANKKIILFASRLVWEKNLRTLIKVYQQIEANETPFHLVVAGDGVAAKELEEAMPNASFLGALDHHTLSIWYASADVFLFTSDTETYGNVVIEAMASGLPVVVADAGGPKDLVTNYFNGIKCPPQDDASFFNAILEITNNEALRTKFINNGLNFVKNLDWDKLVTEYFTIINELSS